MQCESREAGRARSGGGSNSFSPLTPFPCRRRSFQSSVIFGKISSSDLVQWLQSPSWRGGAQRRPLIYLFATGFLVGKKKESRKILYFAWKAVLLFLASCQKNEVALCILKFRFWF